jgi:hypothetical protein
LGDNDGGGAAIGKCSERRPGIDPLERKSVTYSFRSFSAAAEEATLSRIFAGVHFRFDLTTGARLGHNVADFVVDHFLTPVYGSNEVTRSRGN